MQQSVHPHADDEAGTERLDVDVGGAQLHGFFQEVVDGAHDRRAARQVAQALDIVVGVGIGAFDRAGARRLAVLFAQPLGQHRRNVLERGDHDFERAAEDDFGSADGGNIARIGQRQTEAALRRSDREAPPFRAESAARSAARRPSPPAIQAGSGVATGRSARPRRQSHWR